MEHFLIGLHKGNVRHLAREGLAKIHVFIRLEPVLDIFFVLYNLEVCGLIFDQKNSKGFFVWVQAI
jgi:hypothetical protein